ncbi:PUA domain containing protein [Methanocaldococcus villosus KIN24-T80]|uniref:PUA domain containing protein n=1 Tax=Methanocaldococcus villosus KIN24-T80 TaxID=1069083 RepID=N6VXP1_9EURY|nr:DUF5591 domain-containing protein [Methanocaldococcus villosus]ENN95907.1 PUA domain containing protein [Methanocaldococcus villosus KIN24-T80]
MLEPIAYDIGRLCKFKDSFTPNLIDIDIKIDDPKMPFDCPLELKDKFKKSFFGEIDYNGERITYQVLNYGKYVDEIELMDVDLYIIADRRIIERKELQIIKDIRGKISPNSGIYVPATLPWEIPLLAYMGVDFFDDSLAQFYASMGYRLTKNRAIKEDSNNLLEKNKEVYKEILSEVRLAIKNGYLRNLVEETSISHPYLWANYLRYKPDNRNIPLVKDNKIIITANIKVPEVEKYLERLNYEPYSNVIVLLPCSAKKPYSKSKSHRRFIEAIKRSKAVVDEIIITSPFFLVPRALENLVNYDIPVTGKWSYEEIEGINKYLKNFINTVEEKFNEYIIIAFLPEHYLEILDIDCIKIESNKLNELTETLKKYKDMTKDLSYKGRKIHYLKELCKFQFGYNFLPDEIRVNNRGQIFYKNIQLCSIGRNSLLVLTLHGGKRLWEILGRRSNYVEVSYNIKPGSLFPPGFVDCNENIGYRDEVVLIKDDEFVGVGRALMSGAEMKKAKHGALVNIRKVV